MIKRIIGLAAALGIVVSLGGCVSLLPKAKPAQLYRFGIDAPPVPARADARGVGLEPIQFPREAMGDGILTIEGAETSYLAGGRWVGPAPVLFRQALDQAFEASASGVHLRARGEPGPEVASLAVDVVRFEARYTDPKAPPTVRIVLRARLTPEAGVNGAVQTFDVPETASANRVTAIVDAYNRAGTKALTDLAQWVERNTPPAPQSARPAR